MLREIAAILLFTLAAGALFELTAWFWLIALPALI